MILLIDKVFIMNISVYNASSCARDIHTSTDRACTRMCDVITNMYTRRGYVTN